MFRSACGVIALVLVGFMICVPPSARAEGNGGDVTRSVEAKELDAASASVSGSTSTVTTPVLPGGLPAVRSRERTIVGEPSTLFLMGLALFGAARLARRPARTHQ
jgi:hypothetical protein